MRCRAGNIKLMSMIELCKLRKQLVDLSHANSKEREYFEAYLHRHGSFEDFLFLGEVTAFKKEADEAARKKMGHHVRHAYLWQERA